MKKVLARIIALTICLFIIISTFSGMMISVSGEDISNRPFDGDWDNALHFFMRHWHAEPDNHTSFQGESMYNEAADRYFVILEGYIVPVPGGYQYKKRD